MTAKHPELPAVAIDASTVLVLRERAEHLEVLCVRRHPALSAWGGAVAFPGGKVEAGDSLPDVLGRDSPPHVRCRDFGDDEATQRAFTVAAARECLEEVGILPARGAEVGHEAALELRASLFRCGSFRQVLLDRGIGVDLGAFVPLAHWITPPHLSRRFDARFFVLPVPPGQMGASDGMENTATFWMEPMEIAFMFEHGELELAAPTLWMLDMLSGQPNLASVISFANRQTLLPVLPELVNVGSNVVLAMPGYPGHSVCQPRLEGPRSFVLRSGRFVINRETEV